MHERSVQQVGALQQTISKLTRINVELDQNVSDCKAAISQLKSDQERSLKQVTNQFERKVTFLMRKISNLNTQIPKLIASFSTLRQQNDSLKSRLYDSKNESEQLKLAFSQDLLSTKSTYEKAISKLDEQRLLAEAQLEESKSYQADLESVVFGLQQQLQAAIESNTSKSEQISQFCQLQDVTTATIAGIYMFLFPLYSNLLMQISAKL